MDNYPPVDHTFQVSDQSDTILHKPKYLYVGNNGQCSHQFSRVMLANPFLMWSTQGIPFFMTPEGRFTPVLQF